MMNKKVYVVPLGFICPVCGERASFEVVFEHPQDEEPMRIDGCHCGHVKGVEWANNTLNVRFGNVPVWEKEQLGGQIWPKEGDGL